MHEHAIGRGASTDIRPQYDHKGVRSNCFTGIFFGSFVDVTLHYLRHDPLCLRLGLDMFFGAVQLVEHVRQHREK